MKMTINLVNILDRNCPLRTLEMAFQSIKSSKFVGEHAATNSWQLVPSAITRFISD